MKLKTMEELMEMSEEERNKEIVRLAEWLERQNNAVLINRSIYKWILDFVRNCMVVAALFYLATRSGDWWVYGIAGIAGFALLGYCTSYIDSLPFKSVFNFRGKRERLAIGLFALVLQILSLGITVGLLFAVSRIVTVQVQMTKAP